MLVDNRQHVIHEFESAHWDENYEINVFHSLENALEYLADKTADLVFIANQLDGRDGLEIIREIKNQSNGKTPLFVILSDESDYHTRVQQISENIDDFIKIPFDADELICKTNILISELQNVPKRSTKSVASFSGKLSEMNLLDLLQSLELGEKSGIIYLQYDLQHGKVYLKKGLVCDAEITGKASIDAFFSMALWTEGTFVVEFASVEKPEKIEQTTKELVSEGRELLNEWNELKANFKDFEILFDVVEEINTDLLDAKSQELIPLIVSGKKLKEILATSPFSEVEILRLIKAMLDAGVISKIEINGSQNGSQSSTNQPEKESKTDSSIGSQIMDNFVEGIVDKNKSVEDMQ